MERQDAFEQCIPHHLQPWLGPEWETYVVERPWIYSNPIYVATAY